MPVRIQPVAWTVTGDSPVNDIKNITKAAIVGKNHYLTKIEVGVSAAAVGAAEVTITVKDGATLLWKTFIGATSVRGTQKVIDFNPPLQLSTNSAINIDSSAGGAACVITLNMAGYTL